MKGKAAAVFLVLAATLFAPANGSAAAVLFVVTDPFGALVEVDGVSYAAATPTILRGVAAGSHRVTVRRDGYATVTRQVEVGENGCEVLELVLAPRSLALGVFGESAWTLNDRAPGGDLLRVPEGTYRADRGPEGTLRLRPRYPRQRLIDALDLTLPLFVGFTAALSWGQTADADGPRLTPFAIGAWVVNAALLGADVGLHIDRQRFLDAYAAEPLAEDPGLVGQSFAQAEQELAAGRFDAAAALFTRVIERHPYSPLAGRALYTRGRLELMLGQDGQAIADLRRFVTEMPLPAYYDRAEQQLAEALLASGDATGCLARLEAMLLLDASIDREELGWLRARALLSAAREGSDNPLSAVDALLALVADYPASAYVEDYRAALETARAIAGEPEGR